MKDTLKASPTCYMSANKEVIARSSEQACFNYNQATPTWIKLIHERNATSLQRKQSEVCGRDVALREKSEKNVLKAIGS